MKNSLYILLLFFVACATTEQNSRSVETQVVEYNHSIDDSLLLEQQRSVDRIKGTQAKKIVSNATPVGAKEVVHKYVLKTKNNHPKVKKWIKYYSKKDRERFQRFLNRGARYKNIIQDLLVNQGLPPDLYYLGILESGFVTKAKSHAGAVGPWQFMAPTGREYGLVINNYVDERQDPIRSTLAAIRYLKELYRQKKSWSLALAAYNAGPGRVRRAIRRGGVKNYWYLTGKRLLPYDTREYVPQFLAILTIGKNLEKYGFVEKAKELLPPMELAKVPSPVKLTKIAEQTKLPLESLKKLNPHLSKGMTPPGKTSYYHLWIPKEQVPVIASSFKSLKKHRLKGLKVRRLASYRNKARYHRVKRGQNLYRIAKRYGTTIKKLKRLNGLKGSRLYVGQRLKVRKSSYRRTRVVAKKKFHKVRRGENLSRIAKKYRTSVSKLKKMNGLRSGKIYVGQKLRLRGSVKSSKKSRVRRYRVRRGDNLYKIAKKFGLTIRKLKKMNGLKSNRIQKGRYLKVAAN